MLNIQLFGGPGGPLGVFEQVNDLISYVTANFPRLSSSSSSSSALLLLLPVLPPLLLSLLPIPPTVLPLR